ncbi:helix-turn-helix domain-containing protein [Actinacidiphila sp. bgisy145]|uniref:helix-turn-helix domain-containing protein n=1 Tax=Actinacidiphila sp. bgisy145 TaxID=3413792 RepID=UPI003EBD8FE0
MDSDWTRVGAAVRTARNRQNLTQRELAAEVGTSEPTIRAIERGTEYAKITPTLRSIARYFGWAEGSIEAIRDGRESAGGDLSGETGESSRASQLARDGSREALPDGLPVRVVRTLAEGTALDTRVVPLTPDADMVVLVMGKGGASPEAIREALEAWERREGHLDRLGDVSDEPSENT